MATESRIRTAPLKQQLYEHPGRFAFFQAVRLLQQLRGDGAMVGAVDPDAEAVRFRSEVSLAFPPSDITRLAPPGEEESRAVVTVGFLGVATAASFGSLPTPYVEEVLAQDRAKNAALGEFLDLFNHRMVAFFYRAWEKSRPEVQFGARRLFERMIFSLLGLGTEGLLGRLSLDDRALLARAGLLMRTPAPAVALEAALESYFGVPIQVEQFLPAWYEIEPEERSRLGFANATLGEDLFLGSRVCLAQFQFGVRLGPLDWERYEDFFPTNAGFRALASLLRLSGSPDLDFQVRLVLEAEDVPALRLERTPSQACRLGWSTWLRTEPFTEDADDAVLRPETAAPRILARPDHPMEERP